MDHRNQNSPSLQVFENENRIFTHNGKWLHPLFALEDFLSSGTIDPSILSLRDRIIGKAAAVLIVRLGIRQVYGELMSDLGAAFLEARGAKVSWGSRVPHIECRTEELLAGTDDIEEAYAELSRRAGRR